MARRRQQLTIHLTEKFVYDPEAVERGLKAWAMFLSEHVKELLREEAEQEAKGRTGQGE